MRDHVSFIGRSNCKKYLPAKRKSMHLSERISDMCMWEGVKRESDHQKTHRADSGRDTGEQKVKEFKTAGL